MMANTILLVDDDKEFREEFKAYFEAYRIIEAENGEEALKILGRPNDIDLAVLDVNLPGMKGTEVLRQIREIAPDLGVIILTGHSSESVAIEAVKGHADDYMIKPLELGRMNDIISGLLASKADPRAAGGLPGKIGEARRFIERNCYKKVCLKDVAQSVSMSPKYLSKIFKKHAGIGFNEYKLSVKIGEAKKLLKAAGFNVDQIAYKLGYRNAESFSRIFKDITGKSPTQYRKYTGRRKKRNKKGARK